MDFIRWNLIQIGRSGLTEFWGLPCDYTIALWTELKKEEKRHKQEQSIPIAKVAQQLHGIGQGFVEEKKRHLLEFDDFTLYKFSEFDEYTDYTEDLRDILQELKEENKLPEWIFKAIYNHQKLKPILYGEK